MLDIKFIREHPEVVKENIIKKNQHEKLDLVDSTLELDVKHRALIKDIQHLRKQRNELSLAIAQAKKKGEAVDDLHAQAAHIPGKIKALEEEQENIQSQIQHNCALMPNIMHQDVPYGKDDTQNKEIQRWGQTSHKDVLFHGEVLQENGWADFEASARVAGNGFYYLMGDVALLNQALIQYAIQFITKRGYTYVEPPLMINKATLQGVTSFAERGEMIYKVENEDMYLVGTAEHSLIGMFMQQVIDHTKLPIRLCGYSMSFRREVGSHGLDEKGIFRTHQFNKVEQIVLCKPEDSEQYFHELLQNTIDLFVSIGIPIRTLAICSGDLGDMKHQQYDIEAWSPRKQAYIEVGSCSNLTDNQSRLLGIKARHHDGNFFVHTLNNTAIATSRALVALLENNQLPDGRIQIPPVLQSYMGQKEFLEPGKKFL